MYIFEKPIFCQAQYKKVLAIQSPSTQKINEHHSPAFHLKTQKATTDDFHELAKSIKIYPVVNNKIHIKSIHID